MTPFRFGGLPLTVMASRGHHFVDIARRVWALRNSRVRLVPPHVGRVIWVEAIRQPDAPPTTDPL